MHEYRNPLLVSIYGCIVELYPDVRHRRLSISGVLEGIHHEPHSSRFRYRHLIAPDRRSSPVDVPTSSITGDVGLSPAAGTNYAGLAQAEVTGSIYSTNGTGPAGNVNDPALLTTAKNDLTTAYVAAAAQPPTSTFAAGDNQLGGQTLTAGVYAFGHAATANITASSPLVLDGQGNANAVFVFQASSDLVTASDSVVQLVNGAQACHVFWQVGSSNREAPSSAPSWRSRRRHWIPERRSRAGCSPAMALSRSMPTPSRHRPPAR